MRDIHFTIATSYNKLPVITTARQAGDLSYNNNKNTTQNKKQYIGEYKKNNYAENVKYKNTSNCTVYSCIVTMY